MARYEFKLPAMGESVAEATINSWQKEVGDEVEMDDIVVEVSTDKVDSEVPSEVDGKIVEILVPSGEVAKVGQTIAIIEVEGEETEEAPVEVAAPASVETVEEIVETAVETKTLDLTGSDKFYSPLVKSIAEAEGVSASELDAIAGTGKDGRVTKDDMFNYLANRTSNPVVTPAASQPVQVQTPAPAVASTPAPAPVVEQTPSTPITLSSEDEIIEMSRMGKLVAKHMVESKRISPHVQSFIEIDVTNIVTWRNKVKDAYLKREGEKLTFTPILMQAVAKALKKHPMINVSVDGDNIIKRGNINLGMAAALPSGDLIVPVIKNADQLSLIGMTKRINDLANRARANQLKPDEIQGGTYTVTNVGSFGSTMGIPIINQPQVAILALGAIVKKPSVIETPHGDVLGIRHKMIVTHSYDHRVVNGAEGGLFIKTFKDIIEAWDVNQDF